MLRCGQVHCLSCFLICSGCIAGVGFAWADSKVQLFENLGLVWPNNQPKVFRPKSTHILINVQI